MLRLTVGKNDVWFACCIHAVWPCLIKKLQLEKNFYAINSSYLAELLIRIRIAMKIKTFDEQTERKILITSPPTWSGLVFSEQIELPIEFIRRGVLEIPSLLFSTKGRSEVKWRAGLSDFQAMHGTGSIVYIDRDYELENLSMSGEQRVFKLDFDIQKIEQLTGRELITDALLTRHLPRHIMDKDEHIGALMHGINMEIRNGCPSGALYAESISLAIISYFWGKYSIRHSIRKLNGLSPSKLSILKDYIHNNISYDVSLTQMAEIIGITPQHLSRCFKEIMGESPYQYLLKLRIAEAKRLLRNGNFSMTEISYATGFSSPSHFSNTFRKITGFSPRQFQKNI